MNLSRTHGLLPQVLSRPAMLDAVCSTARVADQDFLNVLSRLVGEMGADHGGKYVATLYRSLQSTGPSTLTGTPAGWSPMLALSTRGQPARAMPGRSPSCAPNLWSRMPRAEPIE